MKETDRPEEAVAVKRIEAEDYYGGCPECGKCEDVLDIHSEEWAMCHTHQIKWLCSAGGGADWRDEKRWIETWERIKDYKEVSASDPTKEIPASELWAATHGGNEMTMPKELPRPRSELSDDGEALEKVGVWTIDRKRDLVFDSSTPPKTATLLGMQVGFIRDERGKKVELEVFYLCETSDGRKFCIDASTPYSDD